MQNRSLWFDEGKGSEEQHLRDKQTRYEPKHSILRIITDSGTGEKNVRQRIRDGTTAPSPKASFDEGPVRESHYSEEQIRYEKSCNLLLKRVEELSFVEQHA